jgi:hypothetical protein
MPTLTTEGDKIEVPARLIVRMAERLHRLGPVRVRRRLAARGASRNDAALILATGGEPAAP